MSRLAPLPIRLDFLRMVGAFMVFASHASYLGYTGPGAGFAHHYGHAGVVIFFVLSGYVIAYVCEEKHDTFQHYAVARFARLYSVLLPALLLTPLLDIVGRQMAPELYSSIQDDRPIFRVLANATFMQQSNQWFVKYFSNGPMWSIGYEFWYYALFGIALYLRGLKRLAFGIVAILLTGYKVLLLMPVWLVGVLIFLLHKNDIVFPRRIGNLLAFTCALVFFAIVQFGLFMHPINQWNNVVSGYLGGSSLGFSQWFIRDIILSSLIGLFILCLKTRPGEFDGYNRPLTVAIRYIAGATFSIYLFHVPLILFLRSTGIFAVDSRAGGFALALTAMVCCFLLASVTERKLALYKTAFGKIFNAVGLRP